MSFLKRLAGALSVFLVVAALYAFSYAPLHCDFEKRRLRSVTESILDDRSMQQVPRARKHIADIAGLRASCQREPEIQMILGLNERILGRYDDAVAAYERALQVEKRPEIYLQLGLTYHAAGRRDEAIRSLALAVRFHPPLLEEIPEGLRAEVFQASAS